jgi:hypothetical protein
MGKSATDWRVGAVATAASFVRIKSVIRSSTVDNAEAILSSVGAYGDVSGFDGAAGDVPLEHSGPFKSSISVRLSGRCRKEWPACSLVCSRSWGVSPRSC